MPTPALSSPFGSTVMVAAAGVHIVEIDLANRMAGHYLLQGPTVQRTPVPPQTISCYKVLCARRIFASVLCRANLVPKLRSNIGIEGPGRHRKVGDT